MTCNPYQVAPQADFQFMEMKKEDWKLYYDENLVRISCGSSNTSICDALHLGTAKINADPETYLAKEILFHSGSDHTINGKRYDLEV